MIKLKCPSSDLIMEKSKINCLAPKKKKKNFRLLLTNVFKIVYIYMKWRFIMANMLRSYDQSNTNLSLYLPIYQTLFFVEKINLGWHIWLHSTAYCKLWTIVSYCIHANNCQYKARVTTQKWGMKDNIHCMS